MTVIYAIMFVTGVLGNMAVCLVIVRNRSMHTATNYYLFSLAVSDLVILLLGESKSKEARQILDEMIAFPKVRTALRRQSTLHFAI